MLFFYFHWTGWLVKKYSVLLFSTLSSCLHGCNKELNGLVALKCLGDWLWSSWPQKSLVMVVVNSDLKCQTSCVIDNCRYCQVGCSTVEVQRLQTGWAEWSAAWAWCSEPLCTVQGKPQALSFQLEVCHWKNFENTLVLWHWLKHNASYVMINKCLFSTCDPVLWLASTLLQSKPLWNKCDVTGSSGWLLPVPIWFSSNLWLLCLTSFNWSFAYMIAALYNCDISMLSAWLMWIIHLFLFPFVCQCFTKLCPKIVTLQVNW
jgi:hypothetical protein